MEIDRAYSEVFHKLDEEKWEHIPDSDFHEKLSFVRARVKEAYITLSSQTSANVYQELDELLFEGSALALAACGVGIGPDSAGSCPGFLSLKRRVRKPTPPTSAARLAPSATRSRRRPGPVLIMISPCRKPPGKRCSAISTM